MSTKIIALQPVQDHGWLMGFANLFQKESSAWWRSRRWWRLAVIWLLIVNGILAAGLWAKPSATGETVPDSTPVQESSEELKDVQGVQVFFIIGGIVSAIGVTLLAEGAILDEKKSGTLAWILSKPISRGAFFLAKLVANAIAVLAIMVVLQGLVAFIQLSVVRQALWPVIPFAGGVFLMGLYILFFLTLTMMLSVVVDNRGAAIGIPLALNLGFQFFTGLGVVEFLPYRLIYPISDADPALASMVANQQALPTIMPIVTTIAWILLFIGVALWRMERIEF